MYVLPINPLSNSMRKKKSFCIHPTPHIGRKAFHFSWSNGSILKVTWQHLSKPFSSTEGLPSLRFSSSVDECLYLKLHPTPQGQENRPLWPHEHFSSIYRIQRVLRVWWGRKSSLKLRSYNGCDSYSVHLLNATSSFMSVHWNGAQWKLVLNNRFALFIASSH